VFTSSSARLSDKHDNKENDMRVAMSTDKDIVLRFKNELWKDKRKLSLLTINEQTFLKKTFLNELEARTEVNVIEHLRKNSSFVKIPEIYKSNFQSITMPYIKGIRIFNLFAEIDCILPLDDERGKIIKQTLLRDCNRRQNEIQRSLANLSEHANFRVYPAGSNIEAIIDILFSAIGIDYDSPRLLEELCRFDARWVKFAKVPFRDATTKNMVLASEKLWLGHFDSYSDRRSYMEKSLQSEDGLPDWMNSSVFDFDFSSCLTLTTPEDDFISLNCHERTWKILPGIDHNFSWYDDHHPERTAMTFMVRYFRFGGRKAAYRLLHPQGHKIRFQYDDDRFYFSKLPLLLENVWPKFKNEYPYLFELTGRLSRSLDNISVTEDLFVSTGLAEERTYYADMFLEERST
jgi:hypothetical protein